MASTQFQYPPAGKHKKPTPKQREAFDLLFDVAADKSNDSAVHAFNFVSSWGFGDGFCPRDLWGCDDATADAILIAMSYLKSNRASPEALGYEDSLREAVRVWRPRKAKSGATQGAADA